MKKGFTLIELLAVIVILAIIALIATPIILGIIDDAREKANERSVELYASAVKNAIAAYQLTGTSAPKSFSDLDIQYDGDVVCTTKELYEDGSIYLADCTVNGSEKEYTYGTKKLEIGKFDSICKIAEDSIATGTEVRAKYYCKVDPNKEPYTFYVLNSTTNSVNLIMEGNINSDGTLATSLLKKSGDNVYNEIGWLNKQDYDLAGGPDLSNDGDGCQHGGICVDSSYGPITALDFLQLATSSWTNLNKMTINSITSVDGKTTYNIKEYKMYARMPYKKEVDLIYDTNQYSYPWLAYPEFYTNMIYSGNDIEGYWYLDFSSTYLADSTSPSCYNGCAPFTSGIGVRPVINLSI